MFRTGKALNLIHIHLASEQAQRYPSRSSERGREGENRWKGACTNTNVVEQRGKKSKNSIHRMAGQTVLHAAHGNVMREEAYRGC
jgi:hypothetical protein